MNRCSCNKLFITGNREQSYVVALAAASLSQSISKACSAGLTAKCGCAPHTASANLAAVAPQPLRQRPNPSDGGTASPSSSSEEQLADNEFQWGGCGDDVTFGLQFGQRFGASRWVRKTPSLSSLTDLHNQRVGRKVRDFGDNSQFYGQIIVAYRIPHLAAR